MDLKGILYESKCKSLLEARINTIRNLSHMEFGQSDFQNCDKKKFFLDTLQKYYNEFDKIYTTLTDKCVIWSVELGKDESVLETELEKLQDCDREFKKLFLELYTKISKISPGISALAAPNPSSNQLSANRYGLDVAFDFSSCVSPSIWFGITLAIIIVICKIFATEGATVFSTMVLAAVLLVARWGSIYGYIRSRKS